VGAAGREDESPAAVLPVTLSVCVVDLLLAAAIWYAALPTRRSSLYRLAAIMLALGLSSLAATTGEVASWESSHHHRVKGLTGLFVDVLISMAVSLALLAYGGSCLVEAAASSRRPRQEEVAPSLVESPFAAWSAEAEGEDGRTPAAHQGVAEAQRAL